MKTTDCLIRCYYSSYTALFFACGAIGIAAEGIVGIVREGSAACHGWPFWRSVAMLAAISAYFLDFAASRRNNRPLSRTRIIFFVAFWAILAALNTRLA